MTGALRGAQPPFAGFRAADEIAMGICEGVFNELAHTYAVPTRASTERVLETIPVTRV